MDNGMGDKGPITRTERDSAGNLLLVQKGGGMILRVASKAAAVKRGASQ